ncbi:hypothetical protein BC940DRAFT_337129 [Gongronella butleri]|nr:hypothetical protein BC940DRAFT_337129 [Gongronella butleri]
MDLTLSFQELFDRHRRQHKARVTFDAALEAFYLYDAPNTDLAHRLFALYVLYAYYAAEETTQNPFLCLFLECLDPCVRGQWVERRFVASLLSGKADNFAQQSPNALAQRPDTVLSHPVLSMERHAELKQAVARWLVAPDAVVTSSPSMDNVKLDNATTIDWDALILIRACTTWPRLVDTLPLVPTQLVPLIDLNLLLATNVVPLLLQHTLLAPMYMDALIGQPVSMNSIEVVHHVLTQEPHLFNADFVHAYILKAIQSCYDVDGPWQDKLVRHVSKFIFSLIKMQALQPLSDYVLDLQVFCLEFIHNPGASALYQAITNQ